jgi:hypothetical protein
VRSHGPALGRKPTSAKPSAEGAPSLGPSGGRTERQRVPLGRLPDLRIRVDPKPIAIGALIEDARWGAEKFISELDQPQLPVLFYFCGVAASGDLVATKGTGGVGTNTDWHGRRGRGALVGRIRRIGLRRQAQGPVEGMKISLSRHPGLRLAPARAATSRASAREPLRTNTPPPQHSSAASLQAQNLAWFAFDRHLKGTTAHLAVRREPLRGDTRVHHQHKALAAMRALDGLADFHVPFTLWLPLAEPLDGDGQAFR